MIVGKQDQHTCKNDRQLYAYSTFFIPSLTFAVSLLIFYLHLNSCDGKDAKQRVFLRRLLVVLKKSRLCSALALKSAGFSLADVQGDVLSRMHTTAFSIDQQFRSFVICLPMCHWWDDELHQVAGSHVSCTMYTHIPASVTKFCSRPGFRVNRTVWQTQIWRDKIWCFLLKELDCFTVTSIQWRQNAPICVVAT